MAAWWDRVQTGRRAGNPILLALAGAVPARASLVFQVLNATFSNWTLEPPAAAGPLGTGQWIYAGHRLGDPRPYRPGTGAGVTLPPGYAIEFAFDEQTTSPGAVSFHLCDYRWQPGQAAAGGPANPRSVPLSFSWEGSTTRTGWSVF